MPLAFVPRFCAVALVLSAAFPAFAQTGSAPSLKKEAVLHNGWKVTPAGTAQLTGDMPLGWAVAPDGKTLAMVSAGYNAPQAYLADAATGKIQQTIKLDNAWNGIAWSPDGATLYISGGGEPKIHVLTKSADGVFTEGRSLILPNLKNDKDRKKGEPQAYVSGLAMAQDGKTLFVGNFATDTIYALDPASGAVKIEKRLDANAHPYCLRLASDGKTLYVTQGALASIAALKTDDLSQTQRITTDKHPNDIAFAPDGRMFVSCANSDTVVAIDPDSGLTRERLSVALTHKSPAGAIPNALCVAPDGKTLYVANAGNNAVAVIDIARMGQSFVEGFIPTAWYPTMVWASPSGALLIGSGKGMGAGPNAAGYVAKDAPLELDDNDVKKKRKYVYVGKLLYGMLSALPAPDEKRLAAYTEQVMNNTPYRDAIIERPFKAPKAGSNPIPSRIGDPSPIKHVLYIIKENRTYDQVLGDLKDANGKPHGNGDPELTLFGEDVTPNIHELCRQFVTLDNTFCSGDVSGNGHPWSTSAYGTDIGERSWMMAYGDHADWALTDLDIFPPVGRIWDMCEQMGVPFTSYYYTWTTTNTIRNQPEIWRKGFDDRRDFENADVFAGELKRFEREGKMPSFMIMTLREDHTEGTRPGSFTPRACVASNDLGVGKLVEACSHSKFWKEMAIFVIEDDAQDGADHVEAHRTTALAVSPYTRTGKVDSTAYTTVSLLRTMELILALPPMSQYDAAAPPMYNAFTNKPDFAPYIARPAKINVLEKNAQTALGAKESLAMDFSRPDNLTAVQVDQLNRLLWHSIKGKNVPYPAPVRRFSRNNVHPEDD